MLLGFTEARAGDIWGRHNSQSEDMGAEFVDFACWAIEEPEILDAEASSDDWNECMDNEGIGERLKNKILLEDFEDVRYTATCKYWL